MYRVSPFTYLIGAMLSTAVSGTSVQCSDTELLTINPPAGQTCAEYMNPYISTFGGILLDRNATSGCRYCALDTTDAFLAALNISPSDAWREFGLMWVYIVFNMAMALFLYWVGRMPKNWGKEKRIDTDDTPVLVTPHPEPVSEAEQK